MTNGLYGKNEIGVEKLPPMEILDAVRRILDESKPLLAEIEQLRLALKTSQELTREARGERDALQAAEDKFKADCDSGKVVVTIPAPGERLVVVAADTWNATLSQVDRLLEETNDLRNQRSDLRALNAAHVDRISGFKFEVAALTGGIERLKAERQRLHDILDEVKRENRQLKSAQDSLLAKVAQLESYLDQAKAQLREKDVRVESRPNPVPGVHRYRNRGDHSAKFMAEPIGDNQATMKIWEGMYSPAYHLLPKFKFDLLFELDE